MPELEASRTLVKSAPELWAECSDPAALARHLGDFGEIRITKLEPETAVAWEGEEVRGTVTLESSGWGTRVVLTATPEGSPDPEAEPDPEPAPEPALATEALVKPAAEDAAKPVAEPAAVVPEVGRPGLWARLLGRWRGVPSHAPPPADDESGRGIPEDVSLGEPAPGAQPLPPAEVATASESAAPPQP
jgi:hypothetical protein